MKTRIVLITATLGALTLGALLAPRPVPAQPTDTQGLPFAIYAPSNQPPTVATLQASNQTAVITLRKNQGLGLSWKFNGSTNATLQVFPSIDGTNYASLPILSVTVTNPVSAVTPATTFVYTVTNLTPAQLAGIVSVSVVMTNASTVTLTNGGLTVNRPN